MIEYIKTLIKVKEEIKRAREIFNPFKNLHEGYAVLLEEVDELWDVINEAIQVAAMAICIATEFKEND